MIRMTLEIPSAQLGWFEQMLQSMGWVFHKEEMAQESQSSLSPATRRNINKARKEYSKRETIVCASQEAMQQYFDSL